MATSSRRTEIESLERTFWQSLVDDQPEVASSLLTPTALMVSAQGAMSFDPRTYEKMASNPKHSLLDFRFSEMEVLCPSDDVAIATYRAWQKYRKDGEVIEEDVVDSSTWLRIDGKWRCAAHTEAITQPPPAR